MFLDRDGTVMEDVGYPSDPAQVRLLEGAAAALARFRRAGLALVVVSNQSGIARGLVTESEARAVHQQLVEELKAGGVRLDAAYYCPHGPDDGCACRKPSPHLVRRAAHDLGLDLEQSFFVGDKVSDVETGRRAGCRTVALGTSFPSHTLVEGDLAADDWEGVTKLVLDASEGQP